MWLARNKNGTLCLYSTKPVYNEYWNMWEEKSHFEKDEIFVTNGEYCDPFLSFVELKEGSFPEITFENSPKELVIK